jgi:flagellar basal body P-ring formation protein FlgA
VSALRSCLILAAALATPGLAAAANIQPLDSIQVAAERFVRASLPADSLERYVSAARLDSRLRLSECAAPLEAFSQTAAPGGSGRLTVGVRCAVGQAWTLYVPVSVEVEAPVLVLRRPLGRRARIAPDDVEAQVRRLPGSAAAFINDIGALQGHSLKRSLPVGTVLTVDMLTPDLLIRRGQKVTLIAAIGSVEIRAQGQALADAGDAERVRVQNVNSLKIVEGVVESADVVRVGL